ncbi:molybdopterin-dependent oxidoreductase [Actinoplanes sp. CA-030573]|uniref:molybdopterin-dependent oxidoreductase n=1 Tax=Actinoplanes sp. CA-030573 TaxID=3239898 RepID=UPI003D946F81
MNLSVRAGLSGVAAAGAAVGIAELVAVGTGPLSAPLLAVGGVVVDNVPPAVKDFGVRVFGVHDKTALITGTAILLAAYAFGLGVVAVRRWRLGLIGIALFAAIGVAAALTRHDAGPLAALPSLVGAGVAVVVLHYLLELADAEITVTGEPAALRTPTPALGGATLAGGYDTSGTAVHSAGPTDPTPELGGGRLAAGYDNSGTDIHRPAPDAYGMMNAGSRRRFLRALGITAGVALVAGIGGRLLTSRKAVTKARAAVVLPEPRQTVAPLPSGVQAPGATPFVSSNKDFYRIDTSLYPPQVDPATWQLRIHGMVRNPITITWAELLQRPMIERYVTLTCVSNEVGGDLIGNARWLGTPIKELLDEADPLPGADQVVQRSVDGWTCGSPTATLRDGRDALLAIGMNGEPLPVAHGFPVRMVVPGLYGYVSACKWITEIELSRFEDFDAYWVPRGWSQQAPIKTESRIDTPRDGAQRDPGTVVIAGVAWAQHRGISRVEVQVDDAPWAEATLATMVTSDTWRQWSYRWEATEGKHTIRVRATDGSGQTQTSTPASPAPNGASGWHSVQVTVG